MRITMLGTGHALATACYNTCYVLDDGDAGRLLVDGGGGNTILRQLKAVGYDWTDVREMYVTHKHLDHLMGIVWMMRMFCQSMCHGSYEGEASIYAHDEVLAILRRMARDLLPPEQARFVGDRLHFVEVYDGEERLVMGRRFTFFDIQSTKAKQFGYRADIGGGRALTCCGDEPFAECTRAYAQGSDWLLHEAFCLHAQADVFRPYEKHHSTVRDAACLAESLGVRNLLLYHTEDSDLPNRRARYMAEAREVFRGNICVPDDLETIEL